ncbi:MAG: NUDIX hydrolase N-terminal domain-containing protein [Ardenticatenaceae bacterium]|nr:NUDIX hydrolase N-terminal domain-containing protein [Anaerolineales bacterium]MCB8921258.1 NUDIX hydrolase N-terminal domain-containing protein [Ardenticatenaceae bacterium]MCB8990624.1 NUDIX hydrolase N-terminal domain-containing protein [Ardenticatenaceae bacterium]MCB9004331.1 NUDIX hydrolase N-terminal domain-containing protein [Ardenticatenaceae bacterium]
MTPAQQLASWADKLRDVSAMGGHFAENPYDKANYEVIQTIAMEMMALATGETLAEMEPLRAPVFARPTPITVGDAAVIDGNGRILLIQRADNGKWAMPGGAIEVGETPAEGVVREVLEETGAEVEALALVGIHDSRLCGSVTRHHLYQLTFLCQPVGGNGRYQDASHAHEVLNAGWFPEDNLPADVDPGHITRIPEAYRVWRGDRRAFFDAVDRSVKSKQ